MPSIFIGVDDPISQKALANTIVTSVFMGLVKDRIDRQLNVKIGYGAGFDPYNDPDRGVGRKASKPANPEDIRLHEQLKQLLVRKLGAQEGLVIAEADKWVDASKAGNPAAVGTERWAITGTGKLRGMQGSVAMGASAKQRALDILSNNFIGGTGRAGGALENDSSNSERGAYYGLADCDNGEVYGPISTTRQLFRDRATRWLDAPGHGWIAGRPGPISNAGMSDTPDERAISTGSLPPTYVVGYCHGMIFAEHIVHMVGSGSAYEISMNQQTCKNASCFGCSTFMFANNMPPSWMHIGSAESWVPLPEVASAFSYGKNPEFGGTETCAARARDMNAAWATAVRQWMQGGLEYLPGRIAKSRLSSKLQSNPTDREAANWFLDALTIHGRDDVWRIVQILSDSGET